LSEEAERIRRINTVIEVREEEKKAWEAAKMGAVIDEEVRSLLLTPGSHSFFLLSFFFFLMIACA